MENKNILYQIKTLEKLIVRKLIEEDDVCMHTIPTPTQMQIIDYMVKHNKKDIYQRDLESILNLRRATVSGVLQTMEKNHLIERVGDERDFRIKKIVLNQSAEKLFLEKEKKLEKIENLILQNISEEELKNFQNCLFKMQDNLKNH